MAESSPKEKYIWSSREIEILIALWENEDVLYNTQCMDYFKRDKRCEALERISDTLKIPSKFLLIHKLRFKSKLKKLN